MVADRVVLLTCLTLVMQMGVCTINLRHAVYGCQDWKTKLGKDPQGRADNKAFAPREQQSLFEKYVKELGFQIEQDFRSLMDQVQHACCQSSAGLLPEATLHCLKPKEAS